MNTPVAAFLKELRLAGIALSASGGELVVKTPKNALDKRRLAQLQQHKPALIALLAEQGAGVELSARGREHASHPLSYAQRRLWFIWNYDEASLAYAVPVVLRLRGSLDRRALQESLADIVRRHPVLRTRFADDDGTPVQVIDQKCEAVLQIVDMQDIGSPGGVEPWLRETLERPFDLRTGPLFKLHLLQLAGDDHILVVNMHHIVCDGWSMQIFADELSAFYNHHAHGKALRLPQQDILYTDYCYWQRDWLASDAGQRSLAYWKTQLRDTPVLGLPYDQARGARRGERGGIHAFTVAAPLLKSYCHDKQTSLFVGLLAAYRIFLYRLTQQGDFAIGTPIANRDRKAVEPLIGFFVNTLALRRQIQPDDSFDSVLARETDGMMEAIDHQQLPFDVVVDALHLERDSATSPLFQTLFVLQNAARDLSLGMEGVSCSHLEHVSRSAKFDLSLIVEERGEQLECCFEYASDVFTVATVAGFADAWQILLGELLAYPHTPIVDHSLLNEHWRQRIVHEWAGRRTSYPELAIHEVFERQARHTPEKTAVIYRDCQLSYRLLNRRANQLAHHLMSQGVQSGSAVAIGLERSLDFIVAMLAVSKLGAAYVPLNVDYPAERLRYIVADTETPLVLTLAAHAALFQDFGVATLALDTHADAVAACPVTDPQVIVGVDELCNIIYTSGSTGQPKGVCVTHRGVVRLCVNNNFMTLVNDDRIGHFSNVAFDAATLEVWGALLSGVTLVVAPSDFSFTEITPFIENHLVSVMWIAAALFQSLVENEIRMFDRLRLVLAGGDVLAANAVEKLLRYKPELQLINGYGPTENTVFTCCHLVGPETLERHSSIPIGRPIANTTVYVLDPHLHPLPPGVYGELCTGGDGLARGYLKQERLTRERFVNNPFDDTPGARLYKTGDRVRHLPDGSIEFLGRVDNQVKIRGYRVEPGEVESALLALPIVKQVAVVVDSAQTREKRLVAYWVGTSSAVQQEEVVAALRKRLPSYLVPAVFIRLDRLPVNENGKLDRQALPVAVETPVDMAGGDPRTPAESALLEIWKLLLQKESLGTHDNFFASGGDSLISMQVVSRARKQGISLTVQDVFAHQTVAELATNIGSESATVQVPPNLIPEDAKEITPGMLTLVEMEQQAIDAVVSQVEGGVGNVQDIYPLAPAQEGILFHHLMQPEGDPYQLPNVLGFADKARLDSFVRALQDLVDRHDILRTGVHWQGLEQPVQVVRRQVKLPVEVARFDPRLGEVQPQLEAMLDPARHRLDVSRAPLVKCVVAQDEAHRRWLLGIVVHHLAIDHTTLEMLVHEAQAIEQGLRERLSRPVPFRNFVAQARLGVSEAEHEAFFSKMLSGVDEPTAPYGVLDVRGDGSGVQEVQKQLPDELSQALRRKARRLGVSAASVMHQAWSVVLSRLTGRQEVVFGTVLFGRMQGGEQADRVMGMFINTLPIKLDVAGQEVSQGLKDTHRLIAKLLRHEHAPLALAQRCSGVDAQMPLFTTLLNYRHSAPQDEADDGIESLSGHERTNYPLTLSVDDLGEGFRLVLQAREPIDAQRVCGYMESALEGLLAALDTGSGTTVGEVDILSAGECEQIVTGWNATARSYPQGRCIHELFEQQAARTPDAIAVVVEEQTLTYAELNRQSNQLARHLRALGVVPDSLVGICVERGMNMMVGLLAILKAGGAYVPLDPNYPKERLAFMLEDSAPVALLIEPATRDTLADVAPAVPRINLTTDQTHWNQRPQGNLIRKTSGLTPQHLAYVIYTSGSTGKPKGAMNEHRGIVNRLLWMQEAYALGGQDVVLQKTLFSFDVSVWEFFWPLMVGARLVLAKPEGHKDPAYLSALMHEQSVSTVHFVPSMLQVFLEQQGLSAGSLRQVICSGEALPGALVGRFHAKLPQVRLHNLYGPTEAAVDVTAWACEAGQERALVPIGRPIANTHMYVLDERRRPVPIGVAGELYIGGVQVGRGYLHREDLTAERFVHDPFSAEQGARMYRTGDLGRWTSEGVIEFLGRNDFQVKIRGFRIELGEIESRLAEHPAIAQAVVVAHDDAQGASLLAYLAPIHPLPCEEPQRGEAQRALIEQARAFLTERLPAHMVPGRFMVIDVIPLSPNGKLDRRALPAPQGLPQGLRSYEAPQSEAETRLAALWSELLGVGEVGRQDNFFELGGHSLLAVKLIERMRREGLHADVRDLFTAPTLGELAQALGGTSREVQVPPNLIPEDAKEITPGMLTLVEMEQQAIDAVVSQVEGGVGNVQDIYPLAPAQEGILFHHLMQPEGDPYQLPNVLGFADKARLDSFVRALQDLVDRHDILRTGVHWQGLEQPVQVVRRQVKLPVEVARFDPRLGEVQPQLEAMLDPARHRLDVSRAPLVKCVVAQDEAHRRWLLGIVVHHLAIDHTTLEMLVHEAQAIEQGLRERLSRPVPFRNFVAQARLGVSEAEHEAFFSKMLSGVDEPTAPYGVLDVRGDGSGVQEVQKQLPDELSQALRRKARRLGVSAASVMHQAWSVVLSRLTGRQEVVFGTVLFGRMQGGEQADRVMGMFINTLPIKLDVAGQEVSQGLKDTHRLIAKLLRHEHAPLALAQRCSGVDAQMPLFTTLLNYRHSAPQDEADDGIESLSGHERTNYPLTLSVDDLGEGFRLVLQAREPIDAQRVCGYMESALEGLLAALDTGSGTTVGEVDILSAGECEQIVTGWNATARSYPQGRCIHELFEQQAARTPDAIAVVVEEQTLTYAELNRQSNQLARHLRALGVVPDSLVGICVERGMNMMVGLLAILKAGGAYVPLDPNYPKER
ncbi:MAG: amino acid adenylation domain-containing protein, partial [Burkholderiales bacterium]